MFLSQLQLPIHLRANHALPLRAIRNRGVHVKWQDFVVRVHGFGLIFDDVDADAAQPIFQQAARDPARRVVAFLLNITIFQPDGARVQVLHRHQIVADEQPQVGRVIR